MSDEPLRGPAEARLLHVERGLGAMERDLRNLRRQAIALGQGVWAGWSELSRVHDTPAPAPAPILAVCCSGVDPGTTIPFTDSVFGSGTMTWKAALESWVGWISGIHWPGSGACGAATIAVGYYLSSSALFQVKWIINASSSCPVPSTPTSIPRSGQALAASNETAPCFYCNVAPIIATYAMGTTVAENLLRTGHASQVVTLIFPGTTATNLTSDFANVCDCITTAITLTDSVYGPCTLTYNPVLQSWVGCRTVSYPGTVNCAAGSIAIQYTIEGSLFGNNWQLLVNWAGHVVAGHACPLPGATCSSTLGFSRQVAATYSCNGITTWTFGPSANSPWPGNGAATCKIIQPVP